MLARYYSMTKALVSVGALLLVEKGALSLDGKISAYLPYWDDAKVRVAAGEGEAPVPAERPITVRMLCCHAAITEGMPNIGYNPYTGEGPPFQTLREWASAVNATPLRH